MDEYIKRKDAISASCFGCNQEFSDEPCEPDACAIRQALTTVPTADVVPKSEVERLEIALKECKKDRYQVFPDGHLELLPRTDIDAIKSKVAREIFEEIFSCLEYIEEQCESAPNELLAMREDLVFLRAKYTEGTP